MRATMQCQWQWTARAMRDTHARPLPFGSGSGCCGLPTTVNAITAKE